MSHSDFGRLLLLFKRAHSLPELPVIAMRLIKAVDSGDASAADLERIVSTDPVFAASVLRLANAVSNANGAHIATIRLAILRLGQKSVKAFAVSLIMQKLTSLSRSPEFNAQRLAHHSLFVAFLSRYLYARRLQRERCESEWMEDEIFAAGLLHDLDVALLAQVAPDEFSRIYSYARRTSSSFKDAFLAIYREPMSVLACAAAETWNLPGMFVDVFQYMDEPWRCKPHFPALSCINYANYLAATVGATSEEWPIECELEREVEDEAGLANEEAAKVLELIEKQIESYTEPSDRRTSGFAA